MSGQPRQATGRPSGRAYAGMTALCILLGMALRSDAPSAGFGVDDYAHLAMLKGLYAVERGPLELFTFSDGSPEEVRALQATGFYPWWTYPELRLSHLRPLSSALSWLDLALFDLHPSAYHWHSIAWWVAMVVALALLLRRVLPVPAAILALLLFCLDEAHAMLFGWIAMRNAIVASTFALFALWGYHRFREEGWRPGAWVALWSFSLALLAGEYAIAFLGYALLYELLRAREGRAGAASLAWLAAPLVPYFAARAIGGFGAQGSGMYLDPLREPGTFLAEGLSRFPVLAGDLMLAVPSAWWAYGSPMTAKLVELGLVDAGALVDLRVSRPLFEALGVLGVVLGALIGYLAFARSNDRRAAFLAWGTPLALVPALGSFPESRLLAPPLVGWAVAVGAFVYVSAVRARRHRGPASMLQLAAATAFAAYHVLAPISHGMLESKLSAHVTRVARASVLDGPFDEAALPHQRLLLLGAADPTTTIYVPLVRAVHGRSAPRSCHLLTGSHAPHRLDRVADNAFVLTRLVDGYSAGDTYASVFNREPLQSGERFSVAGMQVTVLEARDGRAVRTRYELDASLDSPSFVLVVQTPDGLQRLPPPPVGGYVVVPPPVVPFRL